MSIHRFTVNVPNPTSKTVLSELRLENAKLANIFPIDVPEANLEVLRAGLALDPCDPGKRNIAVRLAAHASLDIHVTVVTADLPRRAIGGSAMLNLADRRGGKVVGGVLLACIDRSAPEWPGKEVSTSTPCPAVLATTVYGVTIGADPSKRPAKKALPIGAQFNLVAPIMNPKAQSLMGVMVYLEHLGISGATFVPASWNVGILRQGDIFYATWHVNTDNSRLGSFNASIVVASDGSDRTRLICPVIMGQARLEPARHRDRRRPE